MTSNNSKSNKECIDQWSKLYGKPITEEDYSEICENLKGFFDTIMQWSKAESAELKNK